ncbi:MAG: PAS domain-containing protein [Chloroflexota bacterium]
MEDVRGSTFVSSDTLSQLGTLTRDDIDQLEHGAIKVDDDGTILLYNRYEAQLSALDPATTEGKKFFTQVAPCTNNRLFYGKFLEGIEDNELDVEFSYTFTYRMRPTLVRIMMRRDAATRSTWIFVKRR